MIFFLVHIKKISGFVSVLLPILFSSVIFPILLLRREFTEKPQYLGLALGVFRRVFDRNLVYN